MLIWAPSFSASRMPTHHHCVACSVAPKPTKNKRSTIEMYSPPPGTDSSLAVPTNAVIKNGASDDLSKETNATFVHGADSCDDTPLDIPASTMSPVYQRKRLVLHQSLHQIKQSIPSSDSSTNTSPFPSPSTPQGLIRLIFMFAAQSFILPDVGSWCRVFDHLDGLPQQQQRKI